MHTVYSIVTRNVFVLFILFFFTGTDDWQDSRERDRTLLIPFHHVFTNIQTYIYNYVSEMITFLFLTVAHVSTILLLNVIVIHLWD